MVSLNVKIAIVELEWVAQQSAIQMVRWLALASAHGLAAFPGHGIKWG